MICASPIPPQAVFHLKKQDEHQTGGEREDKPAVLAVPPQAGHTWWPERTPPAESCWVAPMPQFPGTPQEKHSPSTSIISQHLPWFCWFFFSSHAESCKPRPRGARVAPRQLWYLSFKDIFSILQCSNTICCFARRRFHRRGAFLGVNCSLKYILTVLEAGKTPQKVPQPWSVMATLTVGETQG